MSKIRIAGTVDDSIVDGEGLRYTIFVQGCPRRCPGCHNPETQCFEGGRLADTAELLAEIAANPLLPQDRKGCALDPPLTVPARAKLHALCKGMPASFYCGFRFGLRLCPLGRYRCGVSREIFNGSSYQHCSSG